MCIRFDPEEQAAWLTLPPALWAVKWQERCYNMSAVQSSLLYSETTEQVIHRKLKNTENKLLPYTFLYCIKDSGIISLIVGQIVVLQEACRKIFHAIGVQLGGAHTVQYKDQSSWIWVVSFWLYFSNLDLKWNQCQESTVPVISSNLRAFVFILVIPSRNCSIYLIQLYIFLKSSLSYRYEHPKHPQH